MNNIAVTATTTEKLPAAKALASQLNLNFIADYQNPIANSFSYLLLFTPDYLGLQKTDNKNQSPFYIDFLSAKIHHRSKQAGLRSELLARSMGENPAAHPTIIDATAGLGRDSFILATLGFEVTMIERSPILHALLQDALRRAQPCANVAPIVERLHLIQADAINWLKNITPTKRPHIIYLDPMFPKRKKSALVKKEMRILQTLLGSDEDATTLFAMALTCATHRVVVKRPRLAPTISTYVPNFSMTGKSSRFDVYIK